MNGKIRNNRKIELAVFFDETGNVYYASSLESVMHLLNRHKKNADITYAGKIRVPRDSFMRVEKGIYKKIR